MTITKNRVNSIHRRYSTKTFLTEPPKSNLKHTDTIEGPYKQNKVCFAESLETVHEIPYKEIFSKADFHLKLPSIPVHRYVPLIVCDPFARPAKKKKVDDEDTFKLPLLDPYGMTGFGLTNKHQTKKNTSMTNTAKKPTHNITQPRTITGAVDKVHDIANTVHFRYSDFILRKMDAISFDRPKS